ncbi:hypothetical protein OGAPHI_006355 [Ogataea philodendri]|uniref:Uncharacterized protein n=1 Tax=Ogataea philodendri TaxID=1378263 RepID=A0A9P8NWD3_9ASCO|nr:uncharacterized protein OGAPHI_006355 [Ogataea philodendri]KAH3661508.1 hypothetical protein OGAPHI_006355 [Ogataea philodendri]
MGDRGRCVHWSVRFWTGSREVKVSLALLTVNGDLTLDRSSIIEIVNGFQRFSLMLFISLSEELTNGLFSVETDCTHVKLHKLFAVLLEQSFHQQDSVLVGTDLCTQIAQVVVNFSGCRAARELPCFVEQVHDSLLVKLASTHQLEALDRNTFLPQFLGVWRHGRDSSSSDIGMVASGSHVEDDFSVVENRRDDSDIGQVRSTSLGMVGNKNIATLELALPEMVLILNGILHGTQMNRNMWSISNQFTIWPKNSTREVQTFLDR